MKNKKIILTLVLLIASLSVFVSLVGLLAKAGGDTYDFKTINGQVVEIYGRGLYKHDTLSVVAQGQASDLVTLFLAVPILILALRHSLKGSLKARLVLTGMLGYFLYTYMSYTFLWNYNYLFLAYVALMSLSLFAFTMMMLSFDVEKLPSKFEKLPINFLGWFQIFIGISLWLMWFGKIMPTYMGRVPEGLEHYTTLVIQAMDLGIIMPVAFLSGFLLIAEKPLGYLLTSIVVIKGIAMLTAISAMIVNQMIMGTKMGLIEVIIFPLLTIFAIFALIVLLKSIKKS